VCYMSTVTRRLPTQLEVDWPSSTATSSVSVRYPQRSHRRSRRSSTSRSASRSLSRLSPISYLRPRQLSQGHSAVLGARSGSRLVAPGSLFTDALCQGACFLDSPASHQTIFGRSCCDTVWVPGSNSDCALWIRLV